MPTERVLVVDDDDSIRDFVSTALGYEGYDVVAASDGATALAALDRSLAPSVILLDMRMPVMDGWEFSRAYRERPGAHAPIVVLTAARDAAEYATEIGAEGFLAKPFDLDELLRTVARHARQR